MPFWWGKRLCARQTPAWSWRDFLADLLDGRLDTSNTISSEGSWFFSSAYPSERYEKLAGIDGNKWRIYNVETFFGVSTMEAVIKK
jgi:hypothetical protein